MCDLLLSVLKKCYILRVGQVKFFFIHWPLKVFFYFTVVGQVTLSSDAQGNSIEVGSSITYTCMLDQRYSQNDVIWMRKTGSISLDLTSNDGHLVPSLASGRYSSASSTDSDGNKLHQLIIRRKSKFLNSLHTVFFFFKENSLIRFVLDIIPCNGSCDVLFLDILNLDMLNSFKDCKNIYSHFVLCLWRNDWLYVRIFAWI